MQQSCYQADLTSSDEVELGLAELEVAMDDGRLLALATTLAHESCKSVGIADASWFLDGTRNVVVVVAKLESEQLDLVWGLLDCIVQHRETGGHGHTLTSGH